MYLTIGGIALAAIMTLSITTPALAAGLSYTLVNAFSIHSEPSTDEVVYRVTTSAQIPDEPNDYIEQDLAPLTVFGYGWLDADTTPITGVFATIHPAFTDSAFAPGEEWHAHTGTVAVVSVPYEEDILCLDSIASPDFSLKVTGSTLKQVLADIDATVSSQDADAATSFTLVVNEDCPTVPVPIYQNEVPDIVHLPLQVITPAPAP